MHCIQMKAIFCVALITYNISLPNGINNDVHQKPIGDCTALPQGPFHSSSMLRSHGQLWRNTSWLSERATDPRTGFRYSRPRPEFPKAKEGLHTLVLHLHCRCSYFNTTQLQIPNFKNCTLLLDRQTFFYFIDKLMPSAGLNSPKSV